MNEIIKKVIKHPAVILGSAGAGVIAGIVFPLQVSWCGFIADAFMQLMKMCVLPILVFSIASSFCRLCNVGKEEFDLRRMLLAFVFGFIILFAVFAVIIAVVKPGNLSSAYRQDLGELLAKNPDFSVENSAAKQMKFFDMLKILIPENIFQSLASGNSIHVLVFFLLIGLSIGSLKEKGKVLLDIAETCFSVCLKVLDWIMYLLPFGMFALLASQMQKIGAGILPAMFRYIVCIYAGCIVCCVICTLIIFVKTKCPVKTILQICKHPLIIAFGTRSSLMAMPSAIDSLVNGFKVAPVNANTVLPLGVMLARYSMMAIYVSAALFAVQLYGSDLQFADYVTVFFLSFLMSAAGAGSPAMVSLSMLSVVFTPLHIPYSAVLVMLFSILAVIDPPLTVLGVYINCTVSLCVDKK